MCVEGPKEKLDTTAVSQVRVSHSSRSRRRGVGWLALCTYLTCTHLPICMSHAAI